MLRGEGRPRRRELRGEDGLAPAAPALGQDKGSASRHSLRGPRFKLIYDEESGALELYDLVADPGEQRNLAAAEPERAAALRAELRARLTAVRAGAAGRAPAVGGAAVLSPEDERQLREIGYLEAGTSASDLD